MELSQAQKDLISLLKQLNQNTEDIVMTLMCCQGEEQATQMIQYLLELHDNKQQITQQTILKKVVEMNN